MPTFHEWKHVSVFMDMVVGSFHQDQGLQFSQTQRSSDSLLAMGWGFGGWFGFGGSTNSTTQTNVDTNSSNDVEWKQGQVCVDALLGPRGKFPVPLQISRGPQIYITQGAVSGQKTGDVVTSRSIDLEISVRTADGAPNPSKSIVLKTPGLLQNFPSGNTTDAAGKVHVTLTKSVAPGFARYGSYAVTANLGQMQRSATITL